MYQNIFLRENEKDIFQTLKNQGIKTKVFESHLAELFNRVYNNFVGYYTFRQEETVYKIIVLPKTIKPSESAEKEFVDYLLHYYRIKNLYKIDNERNIPNSLLQLAFESNNSQEKGHDFLEEFQSHRYRAILQDIEAFFKRHKSSKRIRHDYTSQSIKHKLNLKQNIKEIDKTKIHQIKTKEIIFSMLATVTYNALKLFVTQKYQNKKSEEVVKEAKRVQSKLLKKYKIERGYKLSLQKLQSIKIEKLFSKTRESKQLLVDIKSLFGFEQMYKDDTRSIGYRQDLMTSSLFINPSNFYEWYVYDILKKYAEGSGKSIEFDKNNSETTTNYYLNKEEKASKPDYILTDETNKVKVVIDAKWKNVNKFGDVKPSDYLKLKFDAFLLEQKGYAISPYLVYPHINNNIERKFNMALDDSSIFEFNTLEIDMEFEKYSNSLEFDFEIQKLQESIDKNSKIEEHKSIAKILSSQIEIKRGSILSKLIDAEDNEEREQLKEELDNELQRLGLQLSETLEEQQLLPEIAEILEEYDDVLEDESKKFLQSSSAIYSYYKDKQYEHFDYSMPGSGFWKLIELELNTSFVWNIRILYNVCDANSPWTPIGRSRSVVFYEINPRKKVKLNQYEQNSETRLQGIMLGGIKILLNESDILDEFNIEHRNFLEIELPLVLEKIIDLRNKHAHIKAMPLDKFEELWSTLFQENYDEVNIIKKLLKFKMHLNEER